MESLVTLIQLNRSIGLKPGEINSGIEDTLLFKLKEEIDGINQVNIPEYNKELWSIGIGALN